MTGLLTVNRCPGCGHPHGSLDGWPQCPDHGHYLYQLRVGDDGWTYACQAPRCRHTHTQPGKATMTAQTETAALAIRDGQDFWNAKQLAALTQLGVENASKADLAVFMHRCQATGLDPFSGQITMIRRGGRWTIQTGIDGYRVIAHRAAKREGVELSYGPTYWYDAAGGKHEVWIGDDLPIAASVTVYKDGKPFPGVARFASFAARGKDGQLMGLWPAMGDHLIAKCAEAQALRKAFPQDLEGIQAADEAHAAPAVTVTQVPVNRRPRPAPDPVLADDRYARPVAQIRRGDIEGVRNEIGHHFDAIGLDDTEEREEYVCKLANEDPEDGAEVLTERQLRFALDSLATCADLAALVDLTSPEDGT